MENVSGVVERVTFHNSENGFCVLRVRAKGHRDLVTVVGHVSSIHAGEFIHASGQWFHDRIHGQQFKSTLLNVTAPDTVEGIEKYLGSGCIKGIGPGYAKKLVQAFGDAVFDIIEQTPERLRHIPGIGPHRARIIEEGWSAQKIIREIMVFLYSHGISTTQAVRIYKTYAERAIDVMQNNPYQLAQDIRGIGFLSADKIAEKLGIEKTSLLRARAGITYALMTVMEEGHCGYPVLKLIEVCQNLLDIPDTLIRDALALELHAQNIVSETLGEEPCIFLAGLYRAEKNIAEILHHLNTLPVPWPEIDAEKALGWVEERTHLALSPTQQQAILQALRSKVLVLTGGPGVGKTTLMRALLTILRAKKVSIQLCAPTGRAAKRLSESTGMEAKTIHRLLQMHPHRDSPKDQKLDGDLLVVDEASMIDVPLMHTLVKALPSRAALLLVGDVDQLPSVGPGQVLRDLIEAQAFPVVRLTEIFRQASQSQIITVAHQVNHGKMPYLERSSEESDFYFIPAETPEEALTQICTLVQERIPGKFSMDPVRDIQALCPMTRGLIGSRNLNIELQNLLNPHKAVSVKKFGWTFYIGDKVMQIQNDYEKDVYNGDIGFIESIDLEEGTVTILFEGRSVVYDTGELDEIVLAYATTVHKSQGSEYPVVVLPLLTQHFPMLQKNLVYTALTRGKKLVVCVGQKKALGIALKRGHGYRWSTLQKRLREHA